MTLIEWLRAQLDENERAALAASPGPWAIGFHDREDPDDVPVSDALGRAICDSPDDGVRGGHSAADAHHIATWDPTRVLAEVKAKRAIIIQQLNYAVEIDGEWGCGCTYERIEAGQCPEFDTPQSFPLLLALVGPYAGREGWDEWSVTDGTA